MILFDYYYYITTTIFIVKIKGYPLIVGTTDRTKKFHPLGLAICLTETHEDFAFIFKSLKKTVQTVCNFDYRPTILIADGSAAITNGFKETFENLSHRVMCYAYVIRNIDKNMKLITNQLSRSKIKKDIDNMPLSANPDIFKESIRLFNIKWSEESVFLEYFRIEWVDQLDGWYEGYAIGIPSTNNGLEAVNLQVKSENTFGNRTPVGQFVEQVKQNIVHCWSVARDPANINAKIYAHTPIYSLEDQTNAYHWLLKKKQVHVKTQTALKLNFVSSSSTRNITKEDVENFMRARAELNWDDLDSLFESESSIWCIVLDESDWTSGKCSCSYFSKHYKCKHLLGLSYRKKLPGASISEAAKQIPLGQKRKRGAPTKAKGALVRQVN